MRQKGGDIEGLVTVLFPNYMQKFQYFHILNGHLGGLLLSSLDSEF